MLAARRCSFQHCKLLVNAPPALPPRLRPCAAAGRRGGRKSPVSSGLSTVLQDELKIEKERYRTPETVLEGPPGGYELEDRPNCTVLLLTRSFGDEDICVEVDIDSQGEVPSEVEEEGSDDELDSLPPVRFSVNVVKADKMIAFSCETDGEEVVIQHVSLSDAQDAPEDEEDFEFVPYTGPVFSELDDTLQQAFADYLEERGITAEFGNYLMELVHDKLEVEYMNWLKRVRDFVAS